jgi:hypothetical protein
MKTYLNVLLRNNIDINIIFRTELIFFSTLKNLITEFNFSNNSFYVLKLSNDLIRHFVKHHSLFSFPSFQLLLYLKNNGFGNKDEINDYFKTSLSYNSLY